MEVRRAANEELRSLKGLTDEVGVEGTETRARARALALERSSYKKMPDAPLGKALAIKSRRRAESAKGRKSR